MKKLLQYVQTHLEVVMLVVTSFILLFGFVLMAFGLDFTIRLTPIILALLTTGALFFWKTSTKRKAIAAIIVIVVGYFLELFAVQTGILFGDYSYGFGLGFKIFDTPIFIGLGWFLITLSAWHIAGYNQQLHIVQKFILGAILVVFFDLIFEQFAGAYGLRSWVGGEIPLFNYACWFILSLAFFGLYNWLDSKVKSSLYIACILPSLGIFFWLMLLIA